ncbi:hypothetical protein [Bacillus sp. JCM 19034]|uniref:hypothetical protein n=1 Tax=Bacillus sp. JCM 19034 TaxID=1481928 RepID=UPI000A8221C2
MPIPTSKVTVISKERMNVSFEKLKNMAMILFRSILIIGLSFVILYPIIIKVSIAFKHKSDLYDPTVVFIPKTLR